MSDHDNSTGSIANASGFNRDGEPLLSSSFTDVLPSMDTLRSLQIVVCTAALLSWPYPKVRFTAAPGLRALGVGLERGATTWSET